MSQYSASYLYENIIKAITNKGIASNDITIKEISSMDEFHVRGKQVSLELLEGLSLDEKSIVLDIGCGLGGTCRMIASKFLSSVHGIDITPEYIRSASLLSNHIGINDKTKFIEADALNLPFKSNSIDLVISQHTQMNIKDKAKFYSEIYRVLRNGACFVYYDVFKDNGGENYPLPWADNISNSFLIRPDDLNIILTQQGFKELQRENQTDKGKAFLSQFISKAIINKSLLTGQKLLMGNNTEEKLNNIYNGLCSDNISLESGVYMKSLLK